MNFKSEAHFEVSLVDICNRIDAMAGQEFKSFVILFVDLYNKIFLALKTNFLGKTVSALELK